MEDLQGYILNSNYWKSEGRCEKRPEVSYTRKCKWWGKKDGWVYYDLKIDDRRYYRLRVFRDKMTGKHVIEYAKVIDDCPDERRQVPSRRVKPERINLMYREREREQA